ncbi:MAG: hypothetical protein ACO1TE_21395 [Prosthecobacter sp.]
MIIGAVPSDYASIIDAAPQQFGVFYGRSDNAAASTCRAAISKEEGSYLYEFTSATGETKVEHHVLKDDLIQQMQADNLKYNGGGKCTIEF